MLHSILQLMARHRGVLVGVALVVSIGWAVVSGSRGVRDLLDKQQEIRRLEEENTALELENQKRKDRVDRLATSPSDQDLEIRKMNLAKPGDKILMLPEGGKRNKKKTK